METGMMFLSDLENRMVASIHLVKRIAEFNCCSKQNIALPLYVLINI